MQKDCNYLKILGIAYLLLGTVALVNGISVNISNVFWYSYIAMFIIAIGLLRKDSFLLSSQLNILFIPYIIWNIDFFYRIIVSKPLFGLTDYFFIQGPLIGKIVTLQHVFTIPILLYALYRIKVYRKDTWKLSFIIVTLLYILTRIFTSPELNINCVFESCLPFINMGSLYPLVWFGALFSIIVITHHLILRFPFLKRANK